eukprot:Gb_04156 [translate_table: standard]
MDSPSRNLLFFMIFFTSIGLEYCEGQSFSVKMHHKFSGEVRRWMNWKHGIDTDEWPVEGSKEYYTALYHHDYARHGRSLADYESLSFLPGNETVRISRLGFLHYSFLQLGTPNVTFLVALDTGSDLFWVPCDCEQCAPTSAPSTGLEFDLNVYSPSASKTSKPITCNNSLCDLQRKCSNPNDRCPYKIAYVSANTSSSGTLVEDILYLIPGDGLQTGSVVKAPITFGCGQTQTGSFLDGAAPNGLLGLGIEQISVPTILSKSGLIPNSFSMCFQREGSIGRFTLGDKGTLDQKETPFIIDQTHPTYNVSVKKFYVGKTLVKTEFDALFDTGTSFTYLADPAYKDLTSNFHQQTKDPLLPVDDTIPFEFCYKTRDNQTIDERLKISLNFDGGNNFSVIQPLIFLGDETGNLAGYCLAVIQSNSLTIIGQNFMTGYQIVFDREQYKLGWKESNCYDLDVGTSPEPTPSGPLHSPLAPSASPQKSHTHDTSINSTSFSPRAGESMTNPSAALPANPSNAPHLRSCFVQIALFSFLTFMGILGQVI